MSPEPTSPYRALFERPAYVRVLTAGVASIAGSSIASVCLIWYVYERTGSAWDIGLLAASFLAAALICSVFAGTWVDRYDRRRLMVLADLARAGAMGAIFLDVAGPAFSFPVVLAGNFVIGGFTTLFTPAENAILPSVLPPTLVADGNGLVSSSRSGVSFVGAAVGGLLIVTLGAPLGLGLNALTFLVSAAVLVGMRVPPPPSAPGRAGANYFTDLVAGFRWLYGATGFFQLTLSATFFNFCRNLLQTFLVVFATVLLHGSALVFAGLLAADVAGLAVGSLLVGRTGGVRFAGRAWVVGYGALSGAVMLGMVLWPVPAVAIALIFVLGLLSGYAGTAWLTAAQLLVPPAMQGRYFGVDNLGSVAILPVAQLGGALLFAAFGVPATFLGVALLYLGAGLAFCLPRPLWNLGVVPGGATEATAAPRGER